MEPRYSEMQKVRTIPPLPAIEGFVVGKLFRDGRWIYKLSVSDPRDPRQSFDSWFPEERLES
jgi:hypothetical protein